MFTGGSPGLQPINPWPSIIVFVVGAMVRAASFKLPPLESTFRSG
ncbi:unnamed protein product [Arabidopsis lyrata]|uniref:Uncharacterized protein n=1 Tax=Arabidopsis thaliana x Arabidopsis arenosa TaxID=1240361 RepID=A0A8T1YA91_9BRAS|nr:hypothetical protein ISN45_Aa07g021470 [Arabidopsis thaliana x Arabidopsis arenosa]CAH8262021.1 unnamed protein product [Arabidopsis lyrata]